MKSALVTLLLAVAIPALASHPHDRTCVGQTTVKAQGDVTLSAQWELGRTYEEGDPNKDPHTFIIEAMGCSGDDFSADCLSAKSALIKLSSSQLNQKNLEFPVDIKTDKGDVLFTGVFNMTAETLTGQFNELLGSVKTRAGLLDPATMKLTCVSHPRVKLELNADDAM